MILDDPLALRLAFVDRLESEGRHEHLHSDFKDESISLLQLCTILDAVHCLEVSKLLVEQDVSDLVSNNSSALFSGLLESSKNVNARTENGLSLLHFCGRYQSHRTAKVLPILLFLEPFDNQTLSINKTLGAQDTAHSRTKISFVDHLLVDFSFGLKCLLE